MPKAPRPVPSPRDRAPRVAPAPAPAGHSDAIPALTGLRGLAAFGVFAFHAWVLAGVPDPAPGVPWLGTTLAWFARMGWSGVDVFFTLSAFLLGLPFARAALGRVPRPGLRDYLRRRAARILPAYWAQMLVLFALAFAGLSVRGIGEWPGWGPVLAHAVLWIDAWPQVRPLLASWWTLPVEFAFYLLLPWLAHAFGARRWAWLLLALPVAWLWRAAFQWWPPMGVMTIAWIDHLPGRIDQFAIGLLAAYAWARYEVAGRSIAPRAANAALALAAVAFFALPALLLLDGRAEPDQTVSLHPVVLAWHSLASVVVAAGLLACAARAPWSRWLAAAPLAWLGTISYSFYLWHLPAVAWVRAQSGEAVHGEALWPYFAACLLASLALATLSWWAIERPVQRWARRRHDLLAVAGRVPAKSRAAT
jgi:peptidoglycan/LPS O-acetylase OafA/YrhL